MAITFVSAGTTSNSTTTVAPGLPAGVADGDQMVYVLEWRSTASAPAAPSGWTLATEAQTTHGAEAADTGTAAVAVYLREFVTGDAAPTISVTGRNGGRADILAYHRSAGTGWDVASATGTDSTPDTSHSAVAGSDPGGAGGDWLLVFSGTNGDTVGTTRTSITATWTGCTLGTVTTQTPPTGTTTSGNDLLTTFEDVPVNSGTSSAAPTLTWTWSGSTTADHPATAVIYLRLREQVTAAAAAAGPWQAPAPGRRGPSGLAVAWGGVPADVPTPPSSTRAPTFPSQYGGYY